MARKFQGAYKVRTRSYREKLEFLISVIKFKSTIQITPLITNLDMNFQKSHVIFIEKRKKNNVGFAIKNII